MANLDITNDENLTSNSAPSTSDRLLLIKASTGELQDITVGALMGTPSLDGWIAGSGTWSYSSADSPTFVISINADVTALIGVGDRIKLTQTTTKYFIVTAVGSFSGGVTLVTVYGGTDYTLANAAISSPYYSHAKAPFGFPLDPAKWTITFTDTTNRSQATPTAGTYYNLGSESLAIHIGAWKVELQCLAGVTDNSATANSVRVALSTANNSASDNSMLAQVTVAGASGNLIAISTVALGRFLTLVSKTTYYINVACTIAGAESIDFYNATSTMTLRAICAYL